MTGGAVNTIKTRERRNFLSNSIIGYRKDSYRRTGPISTASDYRQPRILWEPRILKREFAHDKNRLAIGFYPACICTAPAEPGIGNGLLAAASN